MKIYVTGATGFIGNHVVNELITLNNDVVILGRNIEKAKEFSWFDQISFKEINLEKKINFNFQQNDKLIHLAWQGLPNYLGTFHFESNLMIQYDFIKDCIENGLKDISITGTCLEYGMRNGALSPSIQTDPQNPYALAKDTLRKFLFQLKSTYDFDLKWLRLFYMYGKGQSEKSILSQLDKALSNGEKEFNMSGGEQLRDYMEVEKVSKEIVKHCKINNASYLDNICSESPISIKSLVENYLEIKNKKIKLNLGYYKYTTYEPMAFWGEKQFHL